MARRDSGSGLTVTISPRGAARLKEQHPWVYRSDVVDADQIRPGSLVRVLGPRGRFLGTALYSTSSQIAIRMISLGEVSALPGLVAQRIGDAIAYRTEFVSGTDAYRLVFSEADFLPGLIVDRYNDVLSVQILTQAIDNQSIREVVLGTLTAQLNPAGIVERVDPRIRELESLPPRNAALIYGNKSSTTITMNGTGSAGVRFQHDGLEGQKTGAFLDQRENYAAAARYARGEALDVFCYQGGFALHIAPRCATVTGIDSSRPALEMAEKNAALNYRELQWIEANAFDLLKDYAASGKQYDTIVLDPPAFAKTRRDLEKALRGYKELNLRALKMLRPGGILITCSCSFHVSPQDLLETVADAARDTHRILRVLESRLQAKDHPIVLSIPETAYLKCLILRVSN